MWNCSCFGFSLRKNVLILAIIDVVIAIISLVFGTIGLIKVWNHRQSIVDTNPSTEPGRNNRTSLDINIDLYSEQEIDTDQKDELIIAIIVIIVLTIHVAFYAMNLVLGLFLYFAAWKKSRVKCQLWFSLTLIIWIITLISFTVNIISIKGPQNSKGKSHSYFSTTTSVFNILYKAYVLWIVRNYVNLLRFNNARYVADYNVRNSVLHDDPELSQRLRWDGLSQSD